MIKKLFSLLITAAVLFCCAAMAEGSAPAPGRDLVILFTSDVHCGIDQNWGVAGVYAVRRALEAEGKYTLLVDNGDFVQGEVVGTMTKGGALIDVMNAAGYDIAVPGNHEFDYGMERFLELTGRADFPYISANFEKDGELVLAPYVIREFDGVKIALNNGGGSTMYRGSEVLVENAMLDNQVLLNYLTGTLGGVVPEEYSNPHGQGRIVAVEEAPAE